MLKRTVVMLVCGSILAASALAAAPCDTNSTQPVQSNAYTAPAQDNRPVDRNPVDWSRLGNTYTN